MKAVKIIYNSFILAMLVAVLASRSLWIEMRMNCGYIIFIAWIILSAVFFFIGRRKKNIWNFKASILNLVISGAILTLVLGLRRMASVPAGLLREGLHMSRIPLSDWNTGLSLVLLAGIAAILIYDCVLKKNR